MVEQLDVSGYETAEEAARATAQVVKKQAEQIGQDPELEVTLRETDSGSWIVAWPGGPFDWAVKVSGGTPLFGTEPFLTGFIDCDGYAAECKSRDCLEFTNY